MKIHDLRKLLDEIPSSHDDLDIMSFAGSNIKNFTLGLKRSTNLIHHRGHFIQTPGKAIGYTLFVEYNYEH